MAHGHPLDASGDAVLRLVMMVRRRAYHSRRTDRALGTFRLSGQLSIRGGDGAKLNEVASLIPAYRGKSLPVLSGATKSSKKNTLDCRSR
jgi:hypothetical protein